MKKFILTIFFIGLFLILFNTISILAQNNNTAVIPTPTATPIPENEQIAALKAQNELMREYHERILDTVYWSLGVVITVLVLIVGLGWYTNFRIYQNDVANIKGEINKDVEALKTSLKIEMTEAAKKAGQNAVESSLRDVKELKYEMLLLEAKNWEEKGIPANSIYASARAIPLALDTHPDLYIPKILDEMLRILKSKKIIGLHSGVIAKINKHLDTIPEEYITDVTAIKKLIASLREDKDN